jgi:hypothetical protein
MAETEIYLNTCSGFRGLGGGKGRVGKSDFRSVDGGGGDDGGGVKSYFEDCLQQ